MYPLLTFGITALALAASTCALALAYITHLIAQRHEDAVMQPIRELRGLNENIRGQLGAIFARTEAVRDLTVGLKFHASRVNDDSLQIAGHRRARDQMRGYQQQIRNDIRESFW